jgi:VWFA-related protein
MGRRSCRLLLPICPLVLCLPGQQVPVIRTNVQVVEVSIVATDANGSPAEGLKAADFRVWDNGKEQTIATFEKISSQAAWSNAPLPPDTYSNRVGGEGSIGFGKTSRPQVLSMILLDAVNTKYRHQTVARRAVEKILEELQPGERIAIYALGSELRIIHDFSSDKASLLASLSAYHGEVPPQDDLLEDLEYTYRGILHQTPDRIACQQRTAPDTPIELAAKNARILDTLETLEAIANHVKGVPGRKNLLWVTGAFPAMVGQLALQGPIVAPSATSGIPSPYQSNKGYGDQMGRTMAALNDASVSVYPIDARGLSCNNEVIINTDTMRDFADATGGKAFYNRNDLPAGVRAALDDSHEVYMLTYSPTALAQDGALHTIRVQTARPGVHLRYRGGYIAPRKQEEDSAAAAADRLTSVLSSLLDASEIGILASAAESAGDRVRVAIHIDPADLNLTPKAAKWTGALRWQAIQLGAYGERLEGVSQTAEINLEQATYQRDLQQGLPLQIEFPRDPMAVAVRIGVADELGGHVGSVSVPLPLYRAEPSGHSVKER